MSEEYKVGALSALISGKGESADDEGAGGGLFTTARKQKAAKVDDSAKGRSVSDVEFPTEVVKSRKRKNLHNQEKVEKKAKLEKEEAAAEEEEDKSEFSRPSLGRLVQMEDAKERIVDQEKEERTVFVGNLPIAIKEKKVKKIFSEFGVVETVSAGF